MATHILERREQLRPVLKAAVDAEALKRGASYEEVGRLHDELARGAPCWSGFADGLAGRSQRRRWICFFLAWHPCSAGRRAWALWALQAPARCIHSWPEWTALVLTSAFVRHLCSARTGSQACLQARPRQNLERICGP